MPNNGEQKNRRFDGKIEPLFSTLAILDETSKAPESNVTLPSRRSIEDAKEWVDENEK